MINQQKWNKNGQVYEWIRHLRNEIMEIGRMNSKIDMVEEGISDLECRI